MLNKPKLLIGIETLLSGGAESFVVRLSNSLCNKFEVTLFVVYGKRIDGRLLNRQNNKFILTPCIFPFEFLLQKFDGLLFRLRIDFSIRDRLVMSKLHDLIRREKFEVLHSNQFKVDYIFFKANLDFKIPHITTIHGDYISFFKRIKERRFGILNFEQKVKITLSFVSAIVYISDHQFVFFTESLGLTDLKHKFHKIYNGIELPVSAPSVRAEADNSVFTFGMVARGIPEKGWEIAIQAFLLLDLANLRLVLVGESEYLEMLATKYPDERILFAGFSEHPLEWIGKFDVGLLPSTFASESLPTSIIEYMAMGKPSIASDVGEIRNMIHQDGSSAGIVISTDHGKLHAENFTAAMRRFVLDREFYTVASRCAINNSRTFSLTVCSERYTSVYIRILEGI